MTSNEFSRRLLLFPCLLLAFGSACSSMKTARKSKDPAKETAKAPETPEPAAPPSVEVEEASVRGTEFTSMPELETIRFEYDAYALAASARAALQKNADYLKGHPDLEVLVAGHCDERGTTAYNLALGQKRAKAVREYYIRLGVPGKSVATISYGEEKPLCSGPDEDCWSKNRRAQTRIRARTASNHNHQEPPESAPQ